NTRPAGPERGPGRDEALFSSERSIELAAVDLGLDSAEMRRRNLIGAAEMPYKLARLEPGGAAVDTECDSGDYGEVLERCLAEFAWEEKRTFQGRLIDGRYHGIAVACFIEGAGAGPKEAARLELEPDGTAARPMTSSWSMAAPTRAMVARSPSPIWRRMVCGSTRRSRTTTS